MSSPAVTVVALPQGVRSGGVSDGKLGGSNNSSVAKQLNKLKSFLGTLQAHHDPNEEENALRARRKRIDVLIDSLVSSSIQVDQFFSELLSTGYPITEAEIASLHPIVKSGLPLLNAEIRNTMEGGRRDRTYVNEHTTSEDPSGNLPSSESRRRTERQPRQDAAEPLAKRPYPGDVSTNGQMSKVELHDNLQGMFYQLQVLMEQMGQTIYALRAIDAHQVVLPASQLPHHVQLPAPHFELQSPRQPVVNSAGKAPSGRPPYQFQSPVVGNQPPQDSSNKVGSTIPGVAGAAIPLPAPASSSSRKESSKSKSREESSSKKHRNGAGGSSESCWSCGAPASETCSRCKKARYCGPVCQRLDWNEKHHRDCKSPPANSTSKKAAKSP